MSDLEIRSRRNDAPTDPQAVATLAADIYELIGKSDVLNAEGVMALYLALDWQTTNCDSCKCGDRALERAKKELREISSRTGDVSSRTRLIRTDRAARRW
jgi:hypothetical protein